MCSDGGDDDGAGGVAPLDCIEDSRDFRLESWGGEMGVVIVGGCTRDGGAVDYEGINSEAVGYH